MPRQRFDAMMRRWRCFMMPLLLPLMLFHAIFADASASRRCCCWLLMPLFPMPRAPPPFYFTPRFRHRRRHLRFSAYACFFFAACRRFHLRRSIFAISPPIAAALRFDAGAPVSRRRHYAREFAAAAPPLRTAWLPRFRHYALCLRERHAQSAQARAAAAPLSAPIRERRAIR